MKRTDLEMDEWDAQFELEMRAAALSESRGMWMLAAVMAGTIALALLTWVLR